MRKYYRFYRRMEPWAKLTMWVDRGYMKPPKDYALLKMFPHKYLPEDFVGYRKKVKLDPKDPFNKLKIMFFKKYPEYLEVYEGQNYKNEKLVNSFVRKQFKLMREGFSQVKAFEIVEKEFANTIKMEKIDRQIIEGSNISNRSRSLMDVFEQREEFISSQKVKRLERDLPEFLRSEYENYEKNNFNKNNKIINEKLLENKNLFLESNKRDSTRDLNYEPVTYYMSNNKDNDLKDEDNLKLNFLKRSENLLKFYHMFVEMSDGLNVVPEIHVEHLAKETNHRFKTHHKILLRKLEKFDVKLTEEGEIDYSSVNSSSLRAFIQKYETLCKVMLLSKDLDFEIPHLKRISEIKENILSEVDEEYNRLLNLFNEKNIEVKEEINDNNMTYEQIFGISLCKY